MLAKEPGTEAVDRADVGTVDLGELAAQAFGRLFGGAVAKGGMDSRFHLRRRGFGERHHQKLVYIAMFVADQMGTPFGKDRRLSRSGGGGDEQAPARCGNALLLRFGPSDLTRHRSPPPLATARPALRAASDGYSG